MTFQAEVLNGQCLRNVRSGSTIQTLSVHTLFSTKMLPYIPKSRLFLCGNYYQGNYIPRGKPALSSAGNPGNQPLPYAPYYGSTGMTEEGLELPNKDWHFDLFDLQTLDPILIANPDFVGQPDNQEFQTYYAEGPRFEYLTSYKRIIQRDQVNKPFEGISSVTWTPNDSSIYDSDWLGNLMPGGWCLTNRGVTEPILGSQYYEDARKPTDPIPVINRSKRSIQEDWFPFCQRIGVYNSAGAKVGDFDGITTMMFFNLAAVKNPIKPPIDKTLFPDVDGNTPVLNPERQILSFEVWFYLTGVGIKSPRIATIRFWYYSKGITYLDQGAGSSPFSPYMFMNCYYDCDIYTKVNVLQNANNPQAIKTKTIKIPLSSLNFFIGA